MHVFDIQHIKGMKSEVVFSINVNQLATLHPVLFDEYLYVDVTRVAAYLDVTCQGSLLSVLESLRLHFCQGWQQDD